MNYIVYIIETNKGTYYIGQTNNLEKRLTEHTKAGSRGAKYLKRFTDLRVVYKESFTTRSEALKREYALKQLTKTEKKRIIEAND